jgi:hypothetical protein
MTNRRLSLPLAWLATVIVSLLVTFGLYLYGVKGDCKAHEIDGQCGMSSFFGLLCGIFAGAVIFVSMSAYLLVVGFKHRRAARLSSQTSF